MQRGACPACHRGPDIRLYGREGLCSTCKSRKNDGGLAQDKEGRWVFARAEDIPFDADPALCLVREVQAAESDAKSPQEPVSDPTADVDSGDAAKTQPDPQSVPNSTSPANDLDTLRGDQGHDGSACGSEDAPDDPFAALSLTPFNSTSGRRLDGPALSITPQQNISLNVKFLAALDDHGRVELLAGESDMGLVVAIRPVRADGPGTYVVSPQHHGKVSHGARLSCGAFIRAYRISPQTGVEAVWSEKHGAWCAVVEREAA